MLQHSLYNVSLLVDALSSASTKKQLLEVVQKYLNAGAHPFFLQQGIWHIHWHLPEPTVDAAQGIVKSANHKFAEVAKPGHGLPGSLNRVYSPDGKPLQVLEGVLQGAFLEAFAQLAQWHALRQLPRNWQADWDKVVKQMLKHPAANLALVDNILHLDNSFGEGIESGFSGSFTKLIESHSHLAQSFIEKRAKQLGVPKVTEEFLALWTPQMAFRVFSLLRQWFEAPSISATHPAEFLRSLLANYQDGKGFLKQTAKEFLHYRLNPKGEFADFYVANTAQQLWIRLIKGDLSQPATFHSVVRWLRIAPADNWELMVLCLAFLPTAKLQMDSRTEHLVEELLGKDAWKALTVLTDPKHWRDPGKLIPGFHSGINVTSPQYLLFSQKLKESGGHLRKHDARLAEAIDTYVLGSGVSEVQAFGAWEQAVNLLAGDTLFATSHLRFEGTQVPRKADEFLGAEIPRIDIARHPSLGDNGAACKFKIYFTDFPDSQVTGRMDQEGEVEFDNIAVLMPLGRHSLRAAIAETLAALVIPQYIAQLPHRGNIGGGIAFTGEVVAARPTIHILGKLGEKDPEGGPVGSRINPTIAEWIFLWLLGKDSSRRYKFYRQAVENVEGTDEPFFVLWEEAKDLLHRRQIHLRSVYTHTVRAHTKPVGVRLVDNTIVVDQVSERAKRNYQRFVKDTGRELDMKTLVRKTYTTPGGGRLVLDLARTFNQGAFNDLEEVWQMVPDLSLKALAKQTFKF